MTETDSIREGQYDLELDGMANDLASRARHAEADYADVVFEQAEEVVTHHNWFARDWFGPSFYGAVIETAKGTPSEYGDWEMACNQPTMERAIRHMAEEAVIADLIDRAMGKR